MIIGIGIDSIEIERLVRWTQFSPAQLTRIFHEDELDYCFQSPIKTAERLAARFAAREACFKAIAPHYDKPQLAFFILCKAIHIKTLPSGAPQLIIDWDYLSTKGYHPIARNSVCFISLTHTKTIATAMVIIEAPN